MYCMGRNCIISQILLMPIRKLADCLDRVTYMGGLMYSIFLETRTVGRLKFSWVVKQHHT